MRSTCSSPLDNTWVRPRSSTFSLIGTTTSTVQSNPAAWQRSTNPRNNEGIGTRQRCRFHHARSGQQPSTTATNRNRFRACAQTDAYLHLRSDFCGTEESFGKRESPKGVYRCIRGRSRRSGRNKKAKREPSTSNLVFGRNSRIYLSNRNPSIVPT